MRRHRIALYICSCICLAVVARSQDDNVSGVAKKVLADECNDISSVKYGVIHCLKALDELTKTRPNPTEALTELNSGALSPDANAFFDIAERLGALPNLVATANKQPSQTNDVLFAAAEKELKATFRRDPEELFMRVDRQYLKDRPRAFFNLLDLTWQDISRSGKEAAATLDLYRACYGSDATRLFNLIHNLFK